MDRKVKISAASLAPAPNGWRARIITGAQTQAQNASSFAEAVATLPAKTASALDVSVALPTRFAIVERLTLPSLDIQELDGMVRLQLEKTLPYAIEDTTYGFQILSTHTGEAKPQPVAVTVLASSEVEIESIPDTSAEASPESVPVPETTLVVWVIHNSAVEQFCESLLIRKQFPRRLTIWAMHIAVQAPATGTAAGLWQEDEGVVFAVFENGALSFMETIGSPDNVSVELPQALMSAELAGASTEFCAVLIDPALASLQESVTEFFGVPSQELSPLDDALDVNPPVDLTLESWQAELARIAQAGKLKARLITAGIVYALLLLLAFGYLGAQGRRLRTLEVELTVVQPEVDAVLAQQTGWKALAPAINRSRFTAELLLQIVQALPSADVRLTQFDQTPTQFMVEGEAPDANQAIQFGEKLKATPGLSEFQFEASPPSILSNDHAQFRIFGKL